MIACVFSGQGSQYAGMGRDLCAGSPAALQIYEEAADWLGYDVLSLDEEQLSMPRYTQLSVVVLSLAAWKALNMIRPLSPPQSFAGFSAGEYSAMCAAGILAFPDLLRLVNERARLMQEAAETHPGAMFAILGLDDGRLLEVIARPAYSGKVFAANFNCPGQVVISGLSEAAEACAEDMKAAGARRVAKLRVGGAFHTPLMAEASQKFQAFASQMTFRLPSGLFYSNADGGLLGADADWPAYLARHMSSPVLWTQEVCRLQRDGASAWLEFGPGKVLCGLIRKIVPGAAPLPVEDSATLAEAARTLLEM
jgi:[acyl-carrier-protein] S-malonyltransferase